MKKNPIGLFIINIIIIVILIIFDYVLIVLTAL